MKKVTTQSCNAFRLGYKFKKDNTEIKVDKLNKSFLLHGNEIGLIQNNILIIKDCQWKTLTTKERLNGILNEFNLPYRIVQQKYKWFLLNIGNSFEKIEWEGKHEFKLI